MRKIGKGQSESPSRNNNIITIYQDIKRRYGKRRALSRGLGMTVKEEELRRSTQEVKKA